MRVWRICKAGHAATAFTGEGALLYPGRWHHAGTPVVYCSESRALAALEQLVHLHRNRLPPNSICFGIEIADELPIRRVQAEDLPAQWRRQPAPPELRDIGTRWAESRETAALQVPSAVVPGPEGTGELPGPCRRNPESAPWTSPQGAPTRRARSGPASDFDAGPLRSAGDRCA